MPEQNNQSESTLTKLTEYLQRYLMSLQDNNEISDEDFKMVVTNAMEQNYYEHKNR